MYPRAVRPKIQHRSPSVGQRIWVEGRYSHDWEEEEMVGHGAGFTAASHLLSFRPSCLKTLHSQLISNTLIQDKNQPYIFIYLILFWKAGHFRGTMYTVNTRGMRSTSLSWKVTKQTVTVIKKNHPETPFNSQVRHEQEVPMTAMQCNIFMQDLGKQRPAGICSPIAKTARAFHGTGLLDTAAGDKDQEQPKQGEVNSVSI